MKRRAAAVLCALLCMLCTAGVCDALEDALLAGRAGYAIAATAQNGDTAAAVLTGGGQSVLRVAQRTGGQWRVVMDNEKALRGVPELALEREDRLSWTYKDAETQTTTTYSAAYTDGEWGAVQVETVHAYEYFTSSSCVTWRDGCIVAQRWSRHEGDGARDVQRIMPIPAKWMEERVKLASFDPDENLYSNGLDYDWLSREVVEHAAMELLPDYAYVDGHAEEDGLALLMDRPDGARVFVGCTYDEEKGFVLCESTPLPRDAETYIGYENFTGALVLSWQQGESGRSIPLQLAPYADGTWGLYYNVDFIGPTLGRNFIKDEEARYVFGTHPWSDVRTIDWSSVPQTQEEMRAGFDAGGWATPNSANPEDRLHLRAAPRRDAVSLGKYYNGTPVRVLERQGEWTHVSVLGIEGYMMTKYLAFGWDAETARQRADTYLLVGEEAALYERTGDSAPACVITDGPVVAGVLGDDWYHVWDPESGVSGFVSQDALWPGNG